MALKQTASNFIILYCPYRKRFLHKLAVETSWSYLI